MTQPQRVYYGLINQGATCYLNSVLQVLFMTTEIHDRLAPKMCFTDQELRNIFKKLKETTWNTANILVSLKIYNGNEQRDAAECLELILHNVSQQVSEVFQGQLTYTTKCSKDHIINEETNPFWTLPLSLKDAHETNYSVERGFERIFLHKSFSGDSMVYCSECEKKTDAITRCEMVKSPQILILLLKRFDFDYNTMSPVKSDCCVDVPGVLKTKDKKYKLYGMVNHMGSLRGGHYTATILSNEDQTWYEFDDDKVKKAEGQPFAETCRSTTAYLLMYRESQTPHVLNKQGGTSCLNSVLQVLFETIEIHNRLDPKSRLIDQELKDIFEEKKETPSGTENITQSLEIKHLSEQRDAAECLEFILQKVSPQVTEVFKGQLTYTTKCSKHHIINQKEDEFLTLPLSLKDAHDTTYSVEAGFKRIFQPQSLSGDNMVDCSECKKETDATTECEMVKFPQILILHLKRFDFDDTMPNVKSDHCVDVPRALKRKNKKYKLYGMVNQMGSEHYTATILSSEDNIWYEFDDNNFKKAEGQPLTKKTYRSSTAYLLMYREKDPRGKMVRLPQQIWEEMKKKKKQKAYKDAVTQPERPRSRIHHGVTCCPNSVLRVLYMTKEIHDRLDPKLSIMNQELSNMFEELKEKTCKTKNITQSLEIKNVNQQHDTAECLEFILRKVSHQISEVFKGQLTTTTKCSKHHIINQKEEEFLTLSLSLKDAHDPTYNVEGGFERIFQPQSLSGDNMADCSECEKKTDVTRECEMVKFPQILILHLKRFDFDNSMPNVKPDHCVDVPHALKRKNKKYKLYGMVNQMGSLRGGHYTATILSSEDNTWYEFDDDKVTKAEGQPFADTLKSSTAYLLIYRATETSSEDLTVKEEQGEDTGPQEVKADKVEHKRNAWKRNTDEFQKPVETTSGDVTDKRSTLL